MDEVKRAEVEAGELSKGVQAWEQDPYGVSEFLAAKRRARGWTVEREHRVRMMLIDSVEASSRTDVVPLLEWLLGQQGVGDAYDRKLPCF